jgi:succinate dehydrogenase/fumarate reductase-like Fe-S protein
MTEKFTKGEAHGCIVCGKLYQVYVVNDANGKYIDCKVMSAGARHVPDSRRPLVACEKHTAEQVEAAVIRVYGAQPDDGDA